MSLTSATSDYEEPLRIVLNAFKNLPGHLRHSDKVSRFPAQLANYWTAKPDVLLVDIPAQYNTGYTKAIFLRKYLDDHQHDLIKDAEKLRFLSYNRPETLVLLLDEKTGRFDVRQTDQAVFDRSNNNAWQAAAYFFENLEEKSFQVDIENVTKDKFDRLFKLIRTNSMARLESFYKKSLPDTHAKKHIQALQPSILEALKKLSLAQIDEAQQILANTINWKLMEFCNDIYTAAYIRDRGYQARLPDLYNHLVAAPGPDILRARASAYTVLLKLRVFQLEATQKEIERHTYHDKTNEPSMEKLRLFWDEIDNGRPIHKALADLYNVSMTTIRGLYRLEDKRRRYTPQEISQLDLVADEHWPVDYHEESAYRDTLRYAELMRKYFDIEPRATMANLAMEKKERKFGNWQELLTYKLKDEFNEAGERGHYYTSAYSALSLREDKIKNIPDMRNDLTTKLVLPFVLNKAEALGYKILSRNLADSMAQELSRNIWRHSSPTEQLAASSYWHSPRVNLNDKFELAKANKEPAALEWTCLLKEPYITESGAIITPLDSHDALVYEGNVMDHCVGRGTYTTHCLRDNYHIFHIEDADGGNASTLTVQDYMQGDKRLVTQIAHHAYDDAEPLPFAQDEAAKFINLINAQKIDIDWSAVDLSKAAFNNKMNDIGYDYADPGKYEYVFDVYKSCLPKKLTKKFGTTGWDMMSAIPLDDGRTVEEYLTQKIEHYVELAVGGIAKIQPVIQAPPPQQNLRFG